MGQVVGIVLFIIGIGYAFNVFVAYNEHRIATSYTQQTTTPSEVAIFDFNETGTLVFYPNNVGPVPYLFYTNTRGNTVAKALVLPFPASAEASWTGGRISIAGQLEGEHVIVSRITYLSPP